MFEWLFGMDSETEYGRIARCFPDRSEVAGPRTPVCKCSRNEPRREIRTGPETPTTLQVFWKGEGHREKRNIGKKEKHRLVDYRTHTHHPASVLG
ncbi:hypothetical protein [Haloparvum sedimenti]|uniref:hypothetical protein n=1 Tax=Haloparvum sedimenti TaxID=1678448 RepID=UPI000F7A8C8F|nr:hypothetical protein [Haloparvum sedimenti]